MSNLPSYDVRTLIFHTRDKDLCLLPELHIVLFEDGAEVECTVAETRYSHLFWKIFQKYPEVPVTKEHCITTVLKGGTLDTGSHLKLCSNIFKSIVKHMNLFLPEQKEPLLALIYETVCSAQMHLVTMTEEYVTSLDALDFIQIATHPKILELKQAAMADPDKMIKFAYEETLKEIENNPIFDSNGLAQAARSRMAKINQVMQCVAFRGFPSEVDGTIFSKPIWNNYTVGNNLLYDYCTDSRTAAKSHFYSDSSLKNSEYRARIFQLYAMVLEKIVYQDCGSTNHLPWKVRGPTKDEAGTTLYPGDLPMLIGKYYKMSDSPSEPYKVITGDEKDLIGKTIFMRHICGCKNPNVHNVCHVCVGELSQNISRFANLGHLGTVTTTGVFTQNILSIKHVNTSAVMLRILLGPFERNYLNTGPRGEGFYLNKPDKKAKHLLTIAQDEAPGLLDVSINTVLSEISLSRVSSTSMIKLSSVKDGKINEVVLNVKLKKMNSMMSRPLLHYVSQKGWEIDAENNFVIDMSDWDYDEPILVLPNREESFVDLADEVKEMILSSQKLYKKRIEENAPKVLLQELFDVINSKLRINILSFETLVYGLMVASGTDYSMGRNSENPALGIVNTLILHRSLGAAFAFQDHDQAIFDPMYLYQGTRPDSPMDSFICPKEVVEAYQQP